MSDIDPKKLKVAELREELKARGLDAKGNKPQLVKRLEKAIAAEAGGEVAEESCDASMLDTSALDSTAEDSQLEESQQEESQPETEAVQEEQSADQAEPQTVESENEQGSPEPNEAQVEHEDDTDAVQENPEPETDNQHQHDQSDESEPDQNDNQSAECDEPNAEMAGSEAMVEEPVPEVHQEQNQAVENEPESDVKEEDMKPEVDMEEKPEATSEATEPEKEENEMEQGEGTSDIKNEPDDNAEEAGPNPEAEYQVMDAIDEADAPEGDQKKEDMKEEDGKDADDNDRRGTKRRHSRSRSRDRGDRHHRSPRRRSRSRSRSRSARRRSRSRSHGRDRRRSASGERRRRSRSYEQKNDANKAKEIPENEDWLQETKVVFDRFNCDLNMRIDEAGYKGSPITVEGFAFMWSGVRTNYGVSKGKVAYEVKILNHLNVDHLPEEETSRHVVRVGWSTDSTSTQLGEEKFSYGYGGTGKASEDCKFRDYGESFEANDVITACVDFENDGPILISYMKNGNDLGTCFEIDRSELGEQALFPHILSKNCEFEINVGQLETPMFPLTEGFTFINDVPVEDRVRGTLPPSKKEDCEIIMMCGLPAAGKTVWAGKKAAEEPDKKYNVLGTNNIIDKMKVMGLPRKKNYAGRWDVLIDKATKCLTRMLEIAAKKKRNYVVDQTNVYPSAQRRKMRPFEGFQRKAVVIVPNDEEYKKRRESQQKEEGKDVPDDAILEMKANFALPEEGPTFDKVEFIELQREEAQKLVEEYNKEGQAVFPPDQKRWRRDDRFGGRDFRGGRDRYNNRDGGRGGSYNSYSRDRGYYNSNNNDRRGGGGGYRGYNDRKGGSYNRDRGYGNRDRYDSRDRNRRDDRSGSRDYRSNYSGGSGTSWNKNNQGSWGGGNQGSWGGNQGSWGNQQGWGQQGWGQQGYNPSWGNQWGNYNQGTTPAAGQQSYNYNYWNQQPQQQGAWGQQSSTGYTAPSTGTQSSWYGNQSYGNYPAK